MKIFTSQHQEHNTFQGHFIGQAKIIQIKKKSAEQLLRLATKSMPDTVQGTFLFQILQILQGQSLVFNSGKVTEAQNNSD